MITLIQRYYLVPSHEPSTQAAGLKRNRQLTAYSQSRANVIISSQWRVKDSLSGGEDSLRVILLLSLHERRPFSTKMLRPAGSSPVMRQVLFHLDVFLLAESHDLFVLALQLSPILRRPRPQQANSVEDLFFWNHCRHPPVPPASTTTQFNAVDSLSRKLSCLLVSVHRVDEYRTRGAFAG